MKLQGLIPVISCPEIEPLLAFYQQAFRYIVVNKTPGPDGLEWVHLKSDNTYLMLRRQSAEQPHSDPGNNNILLYYYTDDIQAQYRFMQAKGFQLSPLSTTAYGMQEFFLSDPQGNRLAVGQKHEDQ
jgi:uncharacterized glyoxalase superfamily protein PhnB